MELYCVNRYAVLSIVTELIIIINHVNHIYRLHNVTAVLSLQFVLFPLINVLYFCISNARSIRAVPGMFVVCSPLISRFPGKLLRYFLNDFEMVPAAPVITGTTFVFTFHVRYIPVVKSLYFKIFSTSFLISLLLLLLLLLLYTSTFACVTCSGASVPLLLSCKRQSSPPAIRQL